MTKPSRSSDAFSEKAFPLARRAVSVTKASTTFEAATPTKVPCLAGSISNKQQADPEESA